MKKLKWFLALALTLILCGTDSYATLYDYGDATGYADATHSNATWQRLGTSWDSEISAKGVDTSDDGVSWSTDGGLTYGHSTLSAGQSVLFQFEVYKNTWGTHDFDAIRAWIDWDQNSSFDDSDVILSDQWNFKLLSAYEFGEGFAGMTSQFFANVIVPDTAFGDFWLRARVACNADIGNDLNNMHSTGQIWQGEVEDWKLTVAPVPEPAPILLLGTGLIGLAGLGRKKYLKK